MLITFHSKAAADVLMLSEHASGLLQAAGKSFGDKVPEEGVFTVEQLGSAIQGIERAIQNDGGEHTQETEEKDEDQAPVAPMAQAVGLQQRAFPLLEMMRQSVAAGVDVTWAASRGW